MTAIRIPTWLQYRTNARKSFNLIYSQWSSCGDRRVVGVNKGCNRSAVDYTWPTVGQGLRLRRLQPEAAASQLGTEWPTESLHDLNLASGLENCQWLLSVQSRPLTPIPVPANYRLGGPFPHRVVCRMAFRRGQHNLKSPPRPKIIAMTILFLVGACPIYKWLRFRIRHPTCDMLTVLGG